MKSKKNKQVPEEDVRTGAETDEQMETTEQAADQSVEEPSTENSSPTPLEQAIAERNENLDRWHRAEAETENVRKRLMRELQDLRKFQSLALSRDVLPALDNLKRATDAARQSQNLDQLVEGVELVAQQIRDALTSHQIMVIEAIGQPFDTDRHEAVGQLPSADHPPMTVIEELEPGYILHDRLVRPSKVIVSQAPAPAAEEPTE